jgi:hypothetical protein
MRNQTVALVRPGGELKWSARTGHTLCERPGLSSAGAFSFPSHTTGISVRTEAHPSVCVQARDDRWLPPQPVTRPQRLVPAFSAGTRQSTRPGGSISGSTRLLIPILQGVWPRRPRTPDNAPARAERAQGAGWGHGTPSQPAQRSGNGSRPVVTSRQLIARPLPTGWTSPEAFLT